MKRTILSILVLSGAGFFTEALAQEDLLWQWRQEANKEKLAANNRSNVQERLQTEELIGLEEYMMQEQTDPVVQQETPPTNEGQQEGVPVIEEEDREKTQEEQQSETPAIILQRPDEGTSSNLPSSPEIKPIQPQNEQAKEEDSVLEFNFLYFLIQKFKLSEIMD